MNWITFAQCEQEKWRSDPFKGLRWTEVVGNPWRIWQTLKVLVSRKIDTVFASLCLLTPCWDKPIPAWLLLSSSSSSLNKTCEPHAADLCISRISATYSLPLHLSLLLPFPLLSPPDVSPPSPPSSSVSLPAFLSFFVFPSLLPFFLWGFSQVIGAERCSLLFRTEAEWSTALPKLFRRQLPLRSPPLYSPPFRLYSRGRSSV